MDLIVKICGLSTPEAIDAALGAGADMVGLVFFPPSPRYRHAGSSARRSPAHARGRGEVAVFTVDMDEAGDRGDRRGGAARLAAAPRP